MLSSRMLAIALALAAALGSTAPAFAQIPDEILARARRLPEIRKHVATQEQLRELGIAAQTMSDDFAFPNRCYGTLTISDELMAAYAAKGFSLTTLCLALRASWVNFHPETGRPLTIAGLRKPTDQLAEGARPTSVNYLIDIPACFRNGTPYHDCHFAYDVLAGLPESPDRTPELRASAAKMDSRIRRLINAGRYATECTCSDLEPAIETRRSLVDEPQPIFRQKSGRACYLDRIPSCAVRMAKQTVRAGALREEITPFDLDRIFGEDSRTRGFLNEYIEISPRLPRGYGYVFASPEGDDGAPYSELPSGTRIAAGD